MKPVPAWRLMLDRRARGEEVEIGRAPPPTKRRRCVPAWRLMLAHLARGGIVDVGPTEIVWRKNARLVSFRWLLVRWRGRTTRVGHQVANILQKRGLAVLHDVGVSLTAAGIEFAKREGMRCGGWLVPSPCCVDTVRAGRPAQEPASR